MRDEHTVIKRHVVLLKEGSYYIYFILKITMKGWDYKVKTFTLYIQKVYICILYVENKRK